MPLFKVGSRPAGIYHWVLWASVVWPLTGLEDDPNPVDVRVVLFREAHVEEEVGSSPQNGRTVGFEVHQVVFDGVGCLGVFHVVEADQVDVKRPHFQLKLASVQRDED